MTPPTLSLATWNANGFLAAEALPENRRKAKKTSRKLMRDNDIVAIQEAHGQSEHWITFKRQYAKSHKIFHSHDPDSHNKAGVAIFSSSKSTARLSGKKWSKSTQAESSRLDSSSPRDAYQPPRYTTLN